MSDSISKIYDDYQDYEHLCAMLNIDKKYILPLDVDNRWYEHFLELEHILNNQL